MWDWLLSPIDPARAHELSSAVAWHGRAMVLAWGVLAPLAVMIARFFKVMPGQDWPRELDNQTWWRSHWIGHSVVLCLSIAGFSLVLPSELSTMTVHSWLGYSVLLGLIIQVALGLFRGSKGGPTAPASDGSLHGDHYDMTPWRRWFEALHKTLGYVVLALAALTIMYGLWHANGPVWMWIGVLGWWAALLLISIRLQRQGRAIDTYHAIWGADPTLPGNRAQREGTDDVRSDRGDGFRTH